MCQLPFFVYLCSCTAYWLRLHATLKSWVEGFRGMYLPVNPYNVAKPKVTVEICGILISTVKKANSQADVRSNVVSFRLILFVHLFHILPV